MVQKPEALTKLVLPSPSLDVKVRRNLYGYLLSISLYCHHTSLKLESH